MQDLILRKYLNFIEFKYFLTVMPPIRIIYHLLYYRRHIFYCFIGISGSSTAGIRSLVRVSHFNLFEIIFFGGYNLYLIQLTHFLTLFDLVNRISNYFNAFTVIILLLHILFRDS